MTQTLRILTARILLSRLSSLVICAAVRRQPRRQHVLFDLRDDAVPARVVAAVTLGLHERAEAAFARQYLSPGDRVVELGSCIGYVAAHIAKAIGPYGHLTIVEPNPHLRKTLERTAALNFECNHELLAAAISYDIMANYRASHDLIGSHLTSIDETTQAVAPLRLSDIDTKATALVMDIEGAEWSILDHESAAFSRFNKVIVETHEIDGRTSHDFAQELQQYGFEVVDRRGPVLVLMR